jgi:hypothetical protein
MDNIVHFILIVFLIAFIPLWVVWLFVNEKTSDSNILDIIIVVISVIGLMIMEYKEKLINKN